jgi:thiol-disulfide isomerase/thioredoxin
MKQICTSIFILFAITASAQKMNKKIEDSIKNREILINLCSREGLVNFPEMKERYDEEYPAYMPDSTVIDSLKLLVKDQKITVVLGTWCGDSKLQVPHFLKIIDELGIPEERLKFISVDGSKKAEDGILKGLNIQRVPTFIFYDKEKKEIGRIIESPENTLEEDMLQILKEK